MSKSRVAFCALLCSLFVTPLHAEQKKAAPKAVAPPAGSVIRYFNISQFLGDATDETFLKETRQGARLISAELDACYVVPGTSNARDRFVMPLQVNGNRLTGTTQSQERKAQISVSLTRTVSGNTYSFEGKISRAGTAE